MNTSRELGPDAILPVMFTGPDGKVTSLSDTGLALEWECVDRVFRIFFYGLRYGWRHAFRGPRPPRDSRQWREERYEVPLAREIRVVLGATKGLTDCELARRLGRPHFEVTAIMEFHGYCGWNPLNKTASAGLGRGRWCDPEWPAHLIGAIRATDEVVDAFRAAFPRAPLAQEEALRRDWEQLARVAPGFLAPGFGSVMQETENLAVVATKETMLARVMAVASGSLPSPWVDAQYSRRRRR